MRGPAAEVLTVAVTAAVTVNAVRLALALSDGFDGRDPDAGAIGPPWAAAMLALALAGVVIQQRSARPRLLVAALAGIAAGLAMAPLMAGLNGTLQPQTTVLHGDQQFRTESVTRFAATWDLQDYTFRGERAFYPPLWFWLAGRAADLLGTPAWEMVKPFTILTIGAATATAYLLWRGVISPSGALAAAVGASLVLAVPATLGADTRPAWYSPYSCFVAVTGAPWVAAMLDALRRDRAQWRLAALTLFGAGLALTYYLIFVCLLAVLAALVLVPWPGRTVARRFGLAVSAIAILTAPLWIPLLAGMLTGGATQGEWVGPKAEEVNTGFSGPPALTALALAAVAALALTISSPASKAVAAVLAGAVAYQVVSVAVLLLAGNTLQPQRMVSVLWATFGAALPVAFEALRDPRSVAHAIPPALVRPLAAALIVPAIAASFALGAAQASDQAGGEFTRAAYQPVDFTEAEAIARFLASPAGRPADDMTILTTRTDVLLVEPFYGFLPLGVHFAHPASRQDERVAVVRAAAGCPDAGCTTRALTANAFERVDGLVLARTQAGFALILEPARAGDPRPETVTFPAANLPQAVWVRRDFGQTTAFARRP